MNLPNPNREGATRGLINLAEPTGSTGLGVHYMNEWSGNTTFLELMLTRIRQMRTLDHLAAFVHHDLPEKQRTLDILDFYSVQPIEIPLNQTVHPGQQRHIIASRKWSYQNWAGCSSSYCIFDEIIPMGLVGLFSELTHPKKLVVFSPETPFVDPITTDKMVEKLNTTFEDINFNFLCRPLPMGLSPFLIGENLLKNLSRTEVWLPHMYLLSPEAKIPIKIRSALGFEKLDNERRSFLLRSKRDLKRLKAWSGKFDEMTDLDEDPKEVQLEITGRVHHPNCKLPDISHHTDMALDQLGSLLDQCRQIDDLLVTIGDLGNLEHHENFEDLRELLKAKRPYGLHVILDGKSALNDLDELSKWIDCEFDIITIRLDSCGTTREELSQYTSVIEELMNKYPKDGCPTVLNFEIRKYHDNWKAIHTIQEWINKYGISFNWPGYNDYAGQLNHDIRLPVYSPRKRGPCQKILNQMHILPNGDVTACRQDFSGKHVVGNINDRPLLDIWQDMKPLREKTKQEPECATSLCGKCKQSFFV